MTAESDEILDDLWHGCAFAAFVEQAIAQGGTPDREATRLRAYRYYEEALAEKNRQKSQPQSVDSGPAAATIVSYDTKRKAESR
jgi:hypothetical protein